MRKIFSIFIICLLAFSLFACNAGGNSKQLEVATLSENLLGKYYDDKDTEIEIKVSSLVFQNQEMTIYSKDKDYIVKYGENEEELTLQFANDQLTVVSKGVFTKRTAANISSDQQGIYADSLQMNSGIVVRGDSITLENGKQYKLYTDGNQVYYVVDGQKVVLTFLSAIGMGTLTMNDNTYFLTSHQLPAEDGEFTKLLRSILNKLTSTTVKDYAYSLSAQGKLEETILSGEKKYKSIIPSSFEGSGQATIYVKNIDINNLNGILAEIKGDGQVKMDEEQYEAHVQVNIQDGKVFTKYNLGDEDNTQYEIEDLVEAGEEFTDYDVTQILQYLEPALQEVATYEAQLASYGITYSDLKNILGNAFSLTENGLSINITKANLLLAVESAKMFINSKMDLILENAWNEMSDYQKSQYASFDAFKQDSMGEYSAVMDEASQYLDDLKITACVIDVNFNTFAVNVNLDIELKQRETDENDQVTCEYKTHVVVKFENKPVDMKNITKVDPNDYIVNYDDVKALLNKYIPNVQYPTLSNQVEFERKLYNYSNDDEISGTIEFSKVTEAEALALVNAFAALKGESVEDPLYGYTAMFANDEEIKTLEVHCYSSYDDKGNVVAKTVVVYFSIYENDFPEITSVIPAGVTVEYDFHEGNKVWAIDGGVNGSVTWTDPDKWVYILIDGQVYDILDYNEGSYFSISVTESTNIIYQLGDVDYDYQSISVYGSYAATVIGPHYAKVGDTLTFTVSIDDYYADNTVDIKFDNEVIASGLKDGDTFQFEVPENAFYIYLEVSINRN